MPDSVRLIDTPPQVASDGLRRTMNGESVIEIVEVIRRMRGGSQAYWVRGHDGFSYVAKFAGNPQGTRSLINEWFTSRLLRQFGISTPSMRVLQLTRALSQSLAFTGDQKCSVIEPGLHLGSQYPVNPDTTALFDFLPRKLLGRVTNTKDFAKTLVLDLFLGQVAKRQALFSRETSGSAGWRAYMIDHGQSLGGREWRLWDEPEHCLYHDRTVYYFCNLATVCGQTVEQVSALTEASLHQLGEGIPLGWFSPEDKTEWPGLLRRLAARRHYLPDLLKACWHVLSLDLPGGDRLASSREKTGGHCR